jgi:chemotaxis protein MotA
MDKTTIPGLVLGIGIILVGFAMEGGHLGSLVSVSAAMIVMGGALGSVLVATPMGDVVAGLKAIKETISERKGDIPQLMAQLVDLATVARRDGVLALEGKLQEVKDPFLKRSLGFLVDGVEASVARTALETEIDMEAEELVVASKMYEAFGGFAPTIGVLGAVLGLIHVMENLNDPSKLGPGIATAFSATVYGVGSANLIALPLANKLKRKAAIERERKILIAEGILSIQEGLNPRILEEKLKAFAGSHGKHAKSSAEKK